MKARRQLLAVLLGAAALAVVVSWGASPVGPAALMEDDGLDADSIGMDQNAMLANSPKKNAAFLRVFGNYLGKSSSTLKSSPKSATQLSQQGSGGQSSSKSRKGENSKLASQMQAELTAGSADEQMMTPHFVAALNAASRPQMLASTDGNDSKANLVNKEAMAALSMTDKGTGQHILPAKLREKYLFHRDSTELGAANTETPNQAALKAQPASAQAGNMQALAAAPAAQGAQGDRGGASAADNKLLASAPEGISTKQLIRQAAMRQIAVLKAKATIAQSQRPAAAAPAQQPAYTQQMYQPGYGSPMYQPAPQYAAVYPPQPQQAPQPMLSGYGAQAPQWYPLAGGQQQQAGQGGQVAPYNDSPQRLSGYQAPQSRTRAYASFSAPPAQAQQLSEGGAAASVVAAAPVLTPEQVGEQAAAKAAPDMFSPDAVTKGKGSTSSKMQQMLALKSQIMSDYKKNTEDADKQLLMGV